MSAAQGHLRMILIKVKIKTQVLERLAVNIGYHSEPQTNNFFVCIYIYIQIAYMCYIYIYIKQNKNEAKHAEANHAANIPKTKQKKQKSSENLKQQKRVLLDGERGEKRRKRCLGYGFLVPKLDK